MFRFVFLSALLLVIFYMVRRALRDFIRSILPPPNRPDSGTREIRGLMMKDPVCGTYVDVAAALTGSREGKNYFFCSEECRRKFGTTR